MKHWEYFILCNALHCSALQSSAEKYNLYWCRVETRHYEEHTKEVLIQAANWSHMQSSEVHNSIVNRLEVQSSVEQWSAEQWIKAFKCRLVKCRTWQGSRVDTSHIFILGPDTTVQGQGTECHYILYLYLTGVHPCSCKSQSLPAPDTHLTNTDSRTPCHTCITRWVGRGGVGIRWFFNMLLRFTRPSVSKKSRQYFFEKNMFMFTPNSYQFWGIWGPPSENKNESWHKTDCCNVLSDYC